MQDARTRLEKILAERIAVLDGSWGVLIQRQVKGEEAYRGERFKDHPRDVAGDPDLLNLTRPEVVFDIHRQYFAAGADIATTNTFTATSIGQADYGLEEHVYEMNVAGARLARQAADEVDGFVAAPGFADHLVALLLEELLEIEADDRLVLGDDDARSGTGRTGRGHRVASRPRARAGGRLRLPLRGTRAGPV